MQFTKATRKKSKLRLALTGASGSGKTYSALLMAAGLGGKVAVIDTERGSASLYSDVTDFDVLDLAPPYTPEAYIEAINAAAASGYNVLVIDSITHEWNGLGGCMEMVDALAASKYRGNTWAAFSDITPRHRKFLDTINAAPLHVIATMRSKTETAQVDENGKKKVVKLGMKSEQRDGTEYEFTTVLDISHDTHFAMASKDRTGIFTLPEVITTATGEKLLTWLDKGIDTGLTDEVIAEHLAAITDATTMPDLQAAFKAAYRDASQATDSKALNVFTAAKDKQKAALEQVAA